MEGGRTFRRDRVALLELIGTAPGRVVRTRSSFTGLGRCPVFLVHVPGWFPASSRMMQEMLHTCNRVPYSSTISIPMKIGPYERELAFRAAFDSKRCPACGGWRQRSIQVFCDRCEKQLPMNVMKGLRNKASFAGAYYEAMKILRPELYVKKS